MRILVLGSGGREHALAWKIEQSPLCSKLFIAPGNGGTPQVGKNLDLDILDFQEIREFVINNKIEILLVGPEVPLVEGISDALADVPGLLVVGPSRAGAMLEGSKKFAKEFMKRHDIPTAGYLEVSKSNIESAFEHIDNSTTPIVLKADGLAAGKGVLILSKKEEAKTQLKALIDGKFGKASETVIIEEFLSGLEFSVFALTDGKEYLLLPNAKDYKRIGEKDTGLNTGGMGAISPAPFVDEKMMEKVISKIIEPTIAGFARDKMNYLGFVFFGLIEVDGEPFVIEYNCRLGDPETEVILPRISSDFVEMLLAAKNNTLSEFHLQIDNSYCASVVLASGGYPEKYEKGLEISGLEEIDESFVFHAGTKMNESLKTNGGRVMMISSLDSTLKGALAKSYKTAQQISFEGKYFRKDIGYEFIS